MNSEFPAIAWTLAWVIVDIFAIAGAIRIRKARSTHMSMIVLIGAVLMALSHILALVGSEIILASTEDFGASGYSVSDVFLTLRVGAILGLIGSAFFVVGIFVLANDFVQPAAKDST